MSRPRPPAGPPTGPGDVWDQPGMREALAEHNIAEVFRLLTRYGWSQRKIAAMTGQSQSEISEIIGGRKVTSYDVLVRIAEGFGLPRGWLGLAYVPGPGVVAVAGPRVRLAVSVDLDAAEPTAWLTHLRQALAIVERAT